MLLSINVRSRKKRIFALSYLVLLLVASQCKTLFATAEVLNSPNSDEHFKHQPAIVTFHPLDKSDHPDGIVITFEGIDIRNNLHLLQKPPMYALDLAGEEISLETLSQLKEVAPFIYSLNLMETMLTHKGLAILAQFYFQSLRDLDLSDNRFKDADLPYLNAFSRVNKLTIAGNKVTEDGTKHFSYLKELDTLDIGCCPLGNRGIEILSQVIPHIRHLDVRSCDLDDKGLVYISNFTKIESLNVSRNRISTVALQNFLATEQGKKIKVTAENLRQ